MVPQKWFLRAMTRITFAKHVAEPGKAFPPKAKTFYEIVDLPALTFAPDIPPARKVMSAFERRP